MPKEQSEFVKYILELLEPLGDITARGMFGGYAIKKNDLAIAIVVEDEIYFKVDDSNRRDYEKRDSHPFTYDKQGKTITISNWKLPIEILEDQDELIKWAEKSYQVALRAKKIF